MLNLYDAPGADSLHRQPDTPTSTHTVRTVTLAEVLKQKKIPHVDLLKLDVEGSELAALEGLGKKIREVGAIVGEIHPWMVRPDDVVEHLIRHGFSVSLKPEGNAFVFWAHQNKTEKKKTGHP